MRIKNYPHIHYMRITSGKKCCVEDVHKPGPWFQQILYSETLYINLILRPIPDTWLPRLLCSTSGNRRWSASWPGGRGLSSYNNDAPWWLSRWIVPRVRSRNVASLKICAELWTGSCLHDPFPQYSVRISHHISPSAIWWSHNLHNSLWFVGNCVRQFPSLAVLQG